MDKDLQEKIDNLTTLINEKNEELEEKLSKFEKKERIKMLFSKSWEPIVFLILATAYFSVDFNILVTSLMFVLALFSLIITLLFKRYNFDGIFVNILLFSGFFIFVFNWHVVLFYYVFVLTVIFYFLYLAIKYIKSFYLSAFFTFLFFLIVINNIDVLSAPLPFIKKTAELSSSLVKESQKPVSSGVIDMAEELTSKTTETGKKFFLLLTDPEAYYEQLEKEKAKENELPSIGERSFFYFEEIITNEMITKSTINLGKKHEGNIIFKFVYKINPNLYNFTSLAGIEEFKRYMANVSCLITNNLGEKSGLCENSENKKSSLVKILEINDIEEKINYEYKVEVFDINNKLSLSAKYEGVHFAVGKINNNEIKAVQINTILSFGLKFLLLENNELVGYIYLIDKSSSLIERDSFKSKDYLTKIKDLFICFSFVDGKKMVKDFFIENKRLNEIFLFDYFQCYKVDSINIDDEVKPLYVKIKLSDKKFLNDYSWIFYIIAKYEAKKEVNFVVKTENVLVPFYYLKKIGKLTVNSFIYDLKKIKEKGLVDINYNRTLLEKFLREYEIKNLKEHEELKDLEKTEKEFVFKSLVASYLLKKYDFDEESLCYLLKKNREDYDCSYFDLKDFFDLLNSYLENSYDIINKKTSSCNFEEGIKNDFRLFFNIFVGKLERERIFFCKDIEDIYEKNYLDEAISVINKIRDYNLAIYSFDKV